MIDHQPRVEQIFVVGNSRSGTTLMGLILGLNSEVFTFEELHFFGQLWSEEHRDSYLTQAEAQQLAARLLSIQYSDVLRPGDPSDFSEEAKVIIAQLPESRLTSGDVFKVFLGYKAAKNGKKIPCEQTPRNVLYIAEILELYPESRIINMVRDPRDVLLSQKYKWRIKFLGAKNIPYREAFRSWCNYHPFTISKLWNASINAADKFANHPRCRTVRFEDLVTNPEQTMEQICQFLGLEFQPQMLDVPQNEGGVSSHKQITPKRRGIDPNTTGKWRRGGLSVTEIHICQQVTYTNMLNHGYSYASMQPNPLMLALSWAFLPVKLTLALLMNLHRTRNIVEAIRRRL
ncbi:MAG: sulfotransferase [Moorea sp. SIO3G5]|nr:sulfotransferase [Moorena sp. SIO3G5]